VEKVDWKCDVLKNYSEVNLGCGTRPATGISWVFEHVDEAIILEDDCVPHPTFFRFCEDLLEKYRDDKRVMLISGNNYLPNLRPTPYSYSFYRNLGMWGWATWRRAWCYHDMEIKLWPDLRDTTWLLELLRDPKAAEYWHKIFDQVYAAHGDIDCWDYQWTFAIWAQNGLAIWPSTNLVSNIGFGVDATHTKSIENRLNSFPTVRMSFPLKHPPYMVPNVEADRVLFKTVFAIPRAVSHSDLKKRLRRKLSAVIPGPVRKIAAQFGVRST
jgi:hypothetical protein